MEKVIVFDFDKTLTNYDTTLPFFLFCCKSNPIRYLYIPFFFGVKFLSKAKLITVKKEKEIGLKLFCPKPIEEFKNYCYKFSATIRLNELYHKEFMRVYNLSMKIVIASASFQYYLECLFPNTIIIGTLVKTDNKGEIIGISQHPFKKEKATLLQSKGLSEIKCFFTDSKNDLPITRLSEQTIWVKHGKYIVEK